MGTNTQPTYYGRVELRGRAREAMQMPETFALWAQQQVIKTPAMDQWNARQWFGAFLQAITEVPWVVSATSIDMALWPRRDPRQPLVPKQHHSDDPPMPLPSWMQEMALHDAEGAVVLRYISGVLANMTHASYLHDSSSLKAFAKKPGQ
jgi:hypothetical protein